MASPTPLLGPVLTIGGIGQSSPAPLPWARQAATPGIVPTSASLAQVFALPGHLRQTGQQASCGGELLQRLEFFLGDIGGWHA